MGEPELPASRRRPAWQRSRKQIIEAARQLFSQRGYRGTNTRDLAEAAGVAETTLFRHFPTKAHLFQEAVVGPIRVFLNEFAERRSGHPPGVSLEVAAVDFYDDLLKRLTDDSRLLVALLAASIFEESDGELSGLSETFTDLLTYLEDIFSSQAAERGLGVDPMIGSRLMLGMALGVALGDGLLFSDRRHPSHKQLVDEMVKFTSWGLPGRAAGE